MVATVRRCAENVGFVLRPKALMPDGCILGAARASMNQVAARFVT